MDRSHPDATTAARGEQNQLSYLPLLRERGIDVAEIAFSVHWPVYSTPVAMCTALAQPYQRDDCAPHSRVVGV